MRKYVVSSVISFLKNVKDKYVKNDYGILVFEKSGLYKIIDGLRIEFFYSHLSQPLKWVDVLVINIILFSSLKLETFR